jgi:hypothetical protein
VSSFSTDVDDLIAAIQYRRDVLLPEVAFAIVHEAVKHGAEDMARILDAPESFTPTGEKRVETGKGEFAGRHVEGTMIGGISYGVVEAEGIVLGQFGWHDPSDYFLYQDWGTDHIGAAHSLQKSFIATAELFGVLTEAAVR